MKFIVVIAVMTAYFVCLDDPYSLAIAVDLDITLAWFDEFRCDVDIIKISLFLQGVRPQLIEKWV